MVFEGIDGSGTTTQAKLVADRLRARGQTVHVTAEPSSGPIGKHIRTILAGREADRALLALLFAADRLDHWRCEIEPALQEKDWVISDRYLWSSLAYQSLDLPEQWVADINEYAPPPDLIVVVDVPVSVAATRRLGRGARELFDDDPVQQAVRDHYLRLAGKAELPCRVIDGTAPLDKVCDSMLAELDRFFSLAESS